MKRLNAIGVGSVFKTSLVLGATAGLLVGVVLMIGAFINKNFLEGIAYLVGGPFLYGLLGAIVNAGMAWLYNQVAARMGGIEVSFED